MKMCISQATTMGTAFPDDLLAFGRAGWPAAELWLTKLETYLQSHSPEDARRAIEDSGVEAVGAASQGGLLMARGERHDALRGQFHQRLELLETLGVRTLVITADFAADPTSEDLNRALEALAESAATAGRHGVRLALEFQRGAGFCASLDTAVALVTQVGDANLGVCLDLFHYYTGPSKFEDLAYLSPENLAWVQVCDLSGTPRELAGDGDRVMPGDGDFRIGPMMDQLRQVGYAGYVSLEVLNPQLWAIPAAAVADAGLRATGRVLAPASRGGP